MSSHVLRQPITLSCDARHWPHPFGPLFQLVLALFIVPNLLFAQNYGLEAEVVADDIGVLIATDGNETDLTGYTCYQVFITMENEDDFLSSIGGDVGNPNYVTTTTEFWHAALGGATPSGNIPLLLPVYPDVAHDSWVTIGFEGSINPIVFSALGCNIHTMPLGIWDKPIECQHNL